MPTPRSDHELLATRVAELEAKLSTSLDEQSAMSEVLEMIARSPSDAQPVLDAITVAAMRLVGGDAANILRADGELLRFASGFPTADVWPLRKPGTIVEQQLSAHRVLKTRESFHIYGTPETIEAEFPDLAAMWREDGIGAAITVPILYKDELFGILGVRRQGVSPFSEQEIALLETFAAQAWWR